MENDNGDEWTDPNWENLLWTLRENPEFLFRILDMGDCMTGRIASRFTKGSAFFESVINESMGGGHHKGYLNEKAQDFVRREGTLSYGARGRDSFKVVEILTEKLCDNLEERWKGVDAECGRWRT